MDASTSAGPVAGAIFRRADTAAPLAMEAPRPLSALERVAPRRVLRRRNVRRLARAAMQFARAQALCRAGAHTEISKRAVDATLNVVEALLRRVGALAAQRVVRTGRHSMSVSDVEGALRHMRVRAAPEMRVELAQVSPLMLMRALHHELFYAQAEETRASARVQRDVGRVASGIVGAFLQLLLHGAAQRATAHGRRLILREDIKRAHSRVRRVARAPAPIGRVAPNQ